MYSHSRILEIPSVDKMYLNHNFTYQVTSESKVTNNTTEKT